MIQDFDPNAQRDFDNFMMGYYFGTEDAEYYNKHGHYYGEDGVSSLFGFFIFMLILIFIADQFVFLFYILLGALALVGIYALFNLLYIPKKEELAVTQPLKECTKINSILGANDDYYYPPKNKRKAGAQWAVEFTRDLKK